MSRYAWADKLAVILSTLALITPVEPAQSKIVISPAREAFDGPPTLNVSRGGELVGTATLSAGDFENTKT